uniref:Unannotated protein n=1 Tax=freshwater metagenome TaxID=449393 RepID=A0A6J5ZQI7_9ZZZZ
MECDGKVFPRLQFNAHPVLTRYSHRAELTSCPLGLREELSIAETVDGHLRGAGGGGSRQPGIYQHAVKASLLRLWTPK